MFTILLGIVDILGGLAVFLSQYSILFLTLPMAILLIIKGFLSGVISLKSPFFFVLSCIDFFVGITLILLLSGFSGNAFFTIANTFAVIMLIKGIWSVIPLK